MPEDPDHSFLPKHGNYQELLSYQKSVVVYDITYRFAKEHLDKFDRTVDQMIKAARSGKQKNSSKAQKPPRPPAKWSSNSPTSPELPSKNS